MSRSLSRLHRRITLGAIAAAVATRRPAGRPSQFKCPQHLPDLPDLRDRHRGAGSGRKPQVWLDSSCHRKRQYRIAAGPNRSGCRARLDHSPDRRRQSWDHDPLSTDALSSDPVQFDVEANQTVAMTLSLPAMSNPDVGGAVVALGRSTMKGFNSTRDGYDRVLDLYITRNETEVADGNRAGIVAAAVGGDTLLAARTGSNGTCCRRAG